MPMSPGMLARFKELASDEDKELVRVDLREKESVYGYLRLVEANFFVIQEAANDKQAVVKTGETTLETSLITGFSKIPPDDLPDRYLSFGFI